MTLSDSVKRPLSLQVHQKQEVADILRTQGFDFREFKWITVPSASPNVGMPVDRITHTPSGYYFMFDFDRHDQRVSRMTPGPDLRFETRTGGGVWEAQADVVYDWAKSLARELQATDPWAELQEEAERLESGDDEPFTSQEQEEVSALLDELAGQVRARSPDLTDERLGRIEKDVEELKEQVSRISRRMWFNMLVGSVVRWGLESDAAKGILTWAAEGLKRIIGDMPALPPGVAH